MEQEPLQNYPKTEKSTDDQKLKKSQDFYNLMKTRRTIRSFSDKAVPQNIIENCLLTAGTAPSGANKQPWFFGAIKDPQIKKLIRIAAEKEEHLFYNKRAPQTWLNDLKKFGTNEYKPYLEKAPYLIPIFYKTHDLVDGEKEKTYYAKESTGIATGLLITSLHKCGLSTLTHTPSPMEFLNEVLDLPKNQYKPFLLLVTGYVDDDYEAPAITKKSLDQISRFY